MVHISIYSALAFVKNKRILIILIIRPNAYIRRSLNFVFVLDLSLSFYFIIIEVLLLYSVTKKDDVTVHLMKAKCIY
jgi:hypothetical protein